MTIKALIFKGTNTSLWNTKKSLSCGRVKLEFWITRTKKRDSRVGSVVNSMILLHYTWLELLTQGRVTWLVNGEELRITENLCFVHGCALWILVCPSWPIRCKFLGRYRAWAHIIKRPNWPRYWKSWHMSSPHRFRCSQTCNMLANDSQKPSK